MSLRITLCLICCTIFLQVGSAQEIYSLEKCILLAQENSLQVRQAKYAAQIADVNLTQSKHARYPNLNASTRYGWQFGRTIDPTTNSFESQTIGSNSVSLSTGATLYNGNQINNSIKQSKVDLKTAELDAQTAANNISLLVANGYLAIILAQEQVEIARQNLELSKTQLDIAEKQIQAGALPENDRLDFIAAIARDEQVLIDAENQVNINYLSLKQLMEIDPSIEFQIERPAIEVPQNVDQIAFTLEEVYNTALGALPQIQANDTRLRSAELGVDIAKAGYFPTLSVFADLNSFYSTLGRTIGDPITFTPTQDVLINGQPSTIEELEPVTVNTSVEADYFNQINENFGQSIGFSLNIPIYNNYRTRGSVERAKINILNAKVTNTQTRQQVKTDIQQAIANARANKELYESSVKSLDAAKLAFENAQKRFDLGAINSLEFETARNTYNVAQNTLLRSKYQYIFSLKVIDFYLGRPLTID